MQRGIVMPSGSPGDTATLTLDFGKGAIVELTARAYDPVIDEASRMRVAKAEADVEDTSELVGLLAPEAQDMLASHDVEAIRAAGLIWLAAVLGGQVVSDWSGVLDESDEPVPFTAGEFQRACFRVPSFYRKFLDAWLAPRTAEIKAGNG